MAPEVWIIIIFISIVLSIAWAAGLDEMGNKHEEELKEAAEALERTHAKLNEELKKEWEEVWK